MNFFCDYQFSNRSHRNSYLGIVFHGKMYHTQSRQYKNILGSLFHVCIKQNRDPLSFISLISNTKNYNLNMPHDKVNNWVMLFLVATETAKS